MSLEIKRPKGVTVFLILGIFDIISMAVVIGMFFVTPDLYSNLFDPETEIFFVTEYTILQYNDYVLELRILIIVIDILIVIGLLSAKTLGRKIVIGGAIAGILSYAITFVIPGLILFSILLWYMFRTRTKEYFKIPKNI